METSLTGFPGSAFHYFGGMKLTKDSEDLAAVAHVDISTEILGWITTQLSPGCQAQVTRGRKKSLIPPQ